MEALEIADASKTPHISLNPNGILVFKGRSIPENSIDFYRPIMEWLDAYAKEPQPLTTVEMRLEYFNTSSSKCILDIFKRLSLIHEIDGFEVIIKWYFFSDDEDMYESGTDYSKIVKIPFEFISYPADN